MAPKVPYLGILGLKLSKTIVIFHIRNFKFAKTVFLIKVKKINLGQKMPYLGIFELKFEKAFVIFQISTFKFIKIQNFMLKKNKLNLGPKLPDLSIFWTRI